MKRILLAENNSDLRSALALLLETRTQARIVAQACDLECLLREAAATQPDWIIADWDLLGNAPAQTIHRLREFAPLCKIILTSARPELAEQVYKAGADAFVCTIYPPEPLLEAIPGS